MPVLPEHAAVATERSLPARHARGWTGDAGVGIGGGRAAGRWRMHDG